MKRKKWQSDITLTPERWRNLRFEKIMVLHVWLWYYVKLIRSTDAGYDTKVKQMWRRDRRSERWSRSYRSKSLPDSRSGTAWTGWGAEWTPWAGRGTRLPASCQRLQCAEIIFFSCLFKMRQHPYDWPSLTSLGTFRHAWGMITHRNVSIIFLL